MNRKHFILPAFLSVFLCLLAVGSASSSAAKGGPPAAVKHRNLLHNGGFEHWVKPTAQQIASWSKNGPKLLSGLVPAGWQYLESIPATGAMARDAAVRHGGKYSLRIVNASPTTTTDANQMVSCLANTVYRVTCYIKGRDIVPHQEGDAGAMVWMNYGPKKHFWSHQTSSWHVPRKNHGTFGWEKLSFTVDTGPQAAFLKVTVQLRRASGTVWYDDVKLVKVGTYTYVKSY